MTLAVDQDVKKPYVVLTEAKYRSRRVTGPDGASSPNSVATETLRLSIDFLFGFAPQKSMAKKLIVFWEIIY